MRRALWISAVIVALLPTWAQAQTSVVTAGGATQWAPVIVIPASAVNGAGVATVPILFPDGSASAPSVAFASQPGLGLFFTNPGAISIGNSTYGASKIPLEFDYTAIRQGSDISIGWASTTNAHSGMDTLIGRSAAGVISVNSVPTVAFVTADFSTTSVSLATITGLSWTLPANTARNIPFSCKLYYSQATAAVADAFGFQVATVAPTNAQVGGAVETALGTTAYGDATFTTTTAANVVAFTPGSIATIFNAYLDGFIEAPSNASIATVNLMALTGNASDALTVKRGSFCRIY